MEGESMASEKTIEQLMADPKVMAKVDAFVATLEEKNPFYELRFEFEGVHESAKRPKAFRRGEHVKFYDPGDKSKKAIRERVKDAVEAQVGGEMEIPRGECHLRAVYYTQTPTSFNSVDRVLAEQKILRPLAKPDVDNLVKEFMDSCNGLLWEDDGQVVYAGPEKYYSENPRMEFTVTFRCEPVTSKVKKD
jgi:Holliday junction resolvase RusA-like endonuclease